MTALPGSERSRRSKLLGSLVHAPVPRRLLWLSFGLFLFGAGIAFIVAAELGSDPWTVLHEGLAEHVPGTIGQVTVAVSFVILVLWVPLRQRPGLGTIGNAVGVGLIYDLVAAVLPDLDLLVLRWLSLGFGVALIGIGSGFYIGAGLGPGPRDGLMTGFASFGWPIKWVRMAVEATALLIGFLLGGTVGVGTVFFAVAIGPIVHVTLPLLAIDKPSPVGASHNK